MLHKLIIGLTVLCLATAGALAAAPKAASTKSVAPPPVATFGSAASTEEQRRATEISTSYAAGNLPEAQAAAEAFMKSGLKDEKALYEVSKVLADCYRKKGEWAKAATQFMVVRSHCEKGSEDYVRADGMADILRASPSGIYTPPGTAAPVAAAGTSPKTLADDETFIDALARYGSIRATKIKMKVSTIKRAATMQQAVTLYAPCANDAREMFILGPNLPADAPHEVAVAAGTRLQELGAPIISQLQTKFEAYRPKLRQPWGLTNIEKDDIQNLSKVCRELAEVEKVYQQNLPLMAGKGSWPEQEQLQSGSAERATNFTKLADQFVVPKYTTPYGGLYYY
jgi:hypothetical protein